ncbi:MAG: hypothetical protein AB8I08_02930, partial [Sandaracinaceae bacterium]
CTVGLCAGGSCDTSLVCAGTTGSCGCDTCEDCAAQDGFYNVGAPYACCSGSSACTCQDREQRAYSCSGTSCTFTVVGTDTQTSGCSACADGDQCTLDQCSGGSCTFPPAPIDTACPGGICDGGGTCVACTPGASCTPPGVCQVGQIQCSGGGPNCVATGNAPNGTSCVGPTCAINECAGGSCDQSPNCNGTATSCGCDTCQDCTAQDGFYNVGAPYACCSGSSACTCQDRELRSFSCSGTSCSFTVVSSDTVTSGCSACGDGNSCTLDQCSGGSCQFPSAPIDTACPGGVCDGGGTCVPCTPGASCNAGACQLGQIQCSGGGPNCVATGNAPDGTTCPGPLCAPNQCSGGVCDNTPNCAGTATSCGCGSCTDCTAQNGFYNVGAPYACCSGSSACTCQDREQRSYSCSGTSCSFVVVGSDTLTSGCSACNDGNDCTSNTCSGSSCSFPPLGAGTPCSGGTCDGAGTCGTPPTCGPANAGSTVGAPSSGLCTSGTPSSVTGSGPYNWTCNGTSSVACSSNRSCTGPAVWGVGCSDPVPTTNHGASQVVDDQAADIVGQETLTCSQGTWVPSGAGNCFDFSGSCPLDSSTGSTSYFFQIPLLGSDGEWYCEQVDGDTEFGNCEDDSIEVFNLTGPAASCQANQTTGNCCSGVGGICEESCSGSLCVPSAGSCFGMSCQSTGYFNNCDVP